jgi:hypothetical protein
MINSVRYETTFFDSASGENAKFEACEVFEMTVSNTSV